MSRNGSGGYSLPINSWNPAVNGVSATPADWQALIGDVAAAIQGSVASDGQTTMSGNLSMGGYRLAGAGAPSGAGMSLRWEQLIRGADIASAATIAIPLEGQLFAITGSAAITAINATIAGRLVYLKFDAGIVLTHSASLLMPSGVNVMTGTDDIAVFVSVSAGVWRCVSYPRFESANYPSATEPAITWPYMTWADTGNLLLKRRNAANSAWVTLGPLLTPMAVKTGDATQTFKAAPSTADDEVVVQSQVPGMGQTWVNQKANRTFNGIFTNGPRIRHVFVSITSSAAAVLITAETNGRQFVGNQILTVAYESAIQIPIMPFASYKISQLGAGSITVQRWEETV